MNEDLLEFIREEVWRAVSRSAGFVGGMNIGKYSGENVNPVPNLGSIEDTDTQLGTKRSEKEEINNQPRGRKIGKRRQNGARGPR